MQQYNAIFSAPRRSHQSHDRFKHSETQDTESCDSVDVTDNPRLIARVSDESARALLPYDAAVKYGVLPVRLLSEKDYGDTAMLCLVADSFSAESEEAVEFIASRKLIVKKIDTRTCQHAINIAYLGNLKKASANDKIDAAALFDYIFQKAVHFEASDIHIEPDQHDYRIRLRVDGALQSITPERFVDVKIEDLVRYLKIKCNLDHSQVKRSQDGSFTIEQGEQTIRVRASFVYHKDNIKVVLRLFGVNGIEFFSRKSIDFTALGMSSVQSEIFRKYLNMSSGAILVVGATGSGKTTLAHAAVSFLNSEDKNIISLEDPVERDIQGINQVEVSDYAGRSFSELLKAILRQDPDILMVGEVRDKPTAELVLQAGATGHLVLSTFHASSCIEALIRYNHFCENAFELFSVIKLVVATRLIARACPCCRKPDNADSPGKCEFCNSTGKIGRLGVFEFLEINNEFRCDILREISRSNGYLNIEQIEESAFKTGYLPNLTNII